MVLLTEQGCHHQHPRKLHKWAEGPFKTLDIKLINQILLLTLENASSFSAYQSTIIHWIILMSESFTCSLQVIKWFYIYYLIFKSSWQPHVEESAVIIIPILQIRKMGLSGNPTRKIKLRINVLCPKQKLKGPRSQEQMHILLRTLNLSCKSSLWVSEGTSQWYIHWMQKICRLGSGVFKPADCGCFAQKRCRAHSVPSYKKEPEKAEKIGKEDNTGP